jgi:hypothetical protein
MQKRKKRDPSAGACDTYESVSERFKNDPYEQRWAARLLVFTAPLAKGKPLDDSALGRVLSRVGADYVPTTLNKAQLLNEINGAVAESKIYDLYRAGSRLRGALKDLALIADAGKQFILSLNAENDATRLIKSLRPETVWLIRDIIGTVDSIDLLQKRIRDTKKNKQRIPSQLEWLAGAELPCVFQEHFNRRAGTRHIPVVRGI